MTDLSSFTTEELLAEVKRRGATVEQAPDLGRCPTCRGKWPLYVGSYDRHLHTIRCRGCLRIPAECTCS